MKEEILQCLKDNTLPPVEVLRAFGIFCHEVPLGGDVLAFVYCSRRGNYHIFVSLFLSPEARQKVFLHEIYHIVEDMPRIGYIVGLDMYRHEIEIKADEFIKKIFSIRGCEWLTPVENFRKKLASSESVKGEIST